MINVPLDKIIPVTYARDNFASIIKETEGKNFFVLSKGGRPKVVVIDIAYFEKLCGQKMGASDVGSDKEPEFGRREKPILPTPSKIEIKPFEPPKPEYKPPLADNLPKAEPPKPVESKNEFKPIESPKPAEAKAEVKPFEPPKPAMPSFGIHETKPAELPKPDLPKTDFPLPPEKKPEQTISELPKSNLPKTDFSSFEKKEESKPTTPPVPDLNKPQSNNVFSSPLADQKNDWPPATEPKKPESPKPTTEIPSADSLPTEPPKPPVPPFSPAPSQSISPNPIPPITPKPAEDLTTPANQPAQPTNPTTPAPAPNSPVAPAAPTAQPNIDELDIG